METLVLNADGSPISIIPLSAIHWSEAVKLIYLNKVTVLESYPEIVQSPQWSLAKPCVIMTKHFYKNTHKPKFTKLNLLYRDEFKCQYCNNIFDHKNLTMDHVIPKSRGGLKNFENIVLSCAKCNEKKADKYIKPAKEPLIPTYYELMNKRKKHPITFAHPQWQKYLNWDETKIRYGIVKNNYSVMYDYDLETDND